jgi:hypothetical protein
MDLIERARAMVLNPEPTWTAIEQETTDWQTLFVPYLATLALIPAVATFIAWSVLGFGSFGVFVRLPVASGLGLMAVQYGMTLVMVYAWGWLIAMLAPSFGGETRLINGLKLAVYASTPAMLAGVFGAMPGLSFLTLVGAVYSLYLVYLGLPVLMKNPPEKSPFYLAVVAVVGLVGSLVIGMLSSLFVPTSMLGMNESQATPDATIAIPTLPASAPDSTVVVTTPDGQAKVMAESLQDMAKRLEALAAEQEKAAKK